MYDNCLICLELNDENSIQQKCCKHHFHKNCLKDWFSINNSCPLCRTYNTTINCIRYRKYIYNIDYKLNDNFFNNTNICPNPYIIQLKEQIPCAWIASQSDNLKELIPLYILKNRYISYYLRQLLLWENLNKSKLVLKFDGFGQTYLSSSQKFKNEDVNVETTAILVGWLYEVMNKIKIEYNFNYENSMNSLILDLTIPSIL